MVSVSLFENRLFWTDWSDKSVKSVNKFKGLSGNITAPFFLADKLRDQPMQLKVVHPLLQQAPGTNQCS